MKTFKQYLTESEEISSTHTIPVENLPAFKAKIDKVNKAATKLKMPLIRHEVGETVYKEHKVGGQTFHTEHVNVKVSGESPKIKNWQFVGNRVHDTETGIMTAHSAHGQELPKKYHGDGDAIKCDHCGINRKRVGSYVMKHEHTGEHKEIGKTCLKDFTGHDSPEAIAKHFENVTELHNSNHDGEEHGVHQEHVHKTHDIMHAAISSIKKHGFTPTSADTPENPSTKTKLNWHFSTNDKLPRIEVDKSDEHHVEKAIEHAKSTANTNTEFGTNLKSVVSAGMLRHKHHGYIAAAANAYLKHDATPKETSSFNHEPLGKAGDKVSHNGQVLDKKTFFGDYGATHYITAKTDSGHVIKTKTTTDIGHDIKVGDTINVAGKLGTHGVDAYAKVHPKELPITTMAPRTKLSIVKAS